MSSPELKLVDAAGASVWRVGRAPDPWAWIDHQWAGNARWDDPSVSFRTIYAADSLYGCFVELLAYSRPDRNDDGNDLLSGITEDPEDATEFPVPPAGAIPRTWLTGRMIGTAVLTGLYVDVRNSATIAALRPKYLDLALSLGFDDFDSAALESAYPRELTHRLTTDFNAMTHSDGTPLVHGVRFGSRHGDELGMWAIYERPGDDPSSRQLSNTTAELVDENHPDLQLAMTLHGLTWLD